MQAVMLERPGLLRLVQVAESEAPGPDEALLRVRRVGVCGTDLHAYQGTQPFFSYPRILGHEMSVEVISVGASVHNLPVGARCAVEPYIHCGTCPPCRRGKYNCCLALQVLGVHRDGGMRETFLLPAQYLHPSEQLSFDQLALVEPFSIGAHAVFRAQLQPDECVLVVGAGPIGLSVIQCALFAGARVLVLDISEQRLAFCQRQWPRVTCLHGQGDNALALLQDIVADDLPTAVFDATGNAQSMHRSFSFVAHGGRLIFVGLFQGDIAFHDPEFHRRELTLLSSRNALAQDFQRVINYLEAGQVDLTPWMTHRATPDEVVHAFPHWFALESGIIKALVAF